MAVTAVTITQDNLIGSNNYLAIHSPLVFLATATVTGTAPDYLTVNIIDGASTLSTYRAILFRDLGGGDYQYLFRAERALRQQVLFPLDDVDREIRIVYSTLLYNHYRILTLEFLDVDSTENDTVSLFLFNASRQTKDAFSNLQGLFNNTTEEIYAHINLPYAVHYNKVSTGEKDIRCRIGAPHEYDATGTHTDKGVYRAIITLGITGRRIQHWEESAVAKDWFLPSSLEFVEIIRNLYLKGIGGYSDDARYWTSTEESKETSFAYTISSLTSITVRLKTSYYNVLPVRKFTSDINYVIGEWGQYGWVFYKNGTTYYEAAHKDMVIVKEWGTFRITTGAVGTAIGTGTANTAAINIALDLFQQTGKASQYVVTIDNGYTIIKSIIVNVLPTCGDGLHVKFYDSFNGYFKYWWFNQYFAIDEASENIGSIAKVITSIASAESESLGSKKTRKYRGIADSLTKEQMEYLAPILDSPIIEVFDAEKNLTFMATLENTNQPVRGGKGSLYTFTLTFNEGLQYSVTRI